VSGTLVCDLTASGKQDEAAMTASAMNLVLENIQIPPEGDDKSLKQRDTDTSACLIMSRMRAVLVVVKFVGHSFPNCISTGRFSNQHQVY